MAESGWSTATGGTHLTRSQVWDTQLKDYFEDELFATRYVRYINNFNDGDTLNIPSIGQATLSDYEEGQSIPYTAMDTGNFTFTIDQYKATGTYIYDKFKQDTFYMNEVESRFVPEQARAIAKAMEVRALAVGPEGQTASNLNQINGGDHRFVASGTNQVIAPADFARAKYALQMANVPMTNLVAIVHPSVEYELSTLTNLTNLSNNPAWDGIVKTGLSTGMRFITNIYGFDVYTSQNLKQNTAAETIDSVQADAGVANLFFSAADGAQPFIGAVRQAPRVESKRNVDFQRDEYVTTARYGMKLFRPENLVVVLSDTDQVG